MNPIRLGASLLAIVSAAALVACGGGGGSTTSTTSEPALAAGAPDATTQQAVNVTDSAAVVQVALGEKVSETRVGRTLFEYVYKLSATGGAQSVQGVVAKLTGGGAGMTVVQGTVYVGDLAAGASVTPPGTVTFRQDRTTAFDANALAWTLTPFQPPSASACTGLVSNVGETSLFPANVAIITAVFAPATAASGNTPAVPEHCNLAGTIRAGRVGEQSSPGVTQTYAIKWQVRLPTTWNGRYVHEGGGGLDGSVPATTSRLAAGYAQGGDDSGHDNAVNNDPLAAGTGAFGTDPQARTDFFYQAITDTTTVARGLQTLYYNKLPDKAYFEGCSMGGREAMMATQRLGQYYDGVVVGDPGFRLPLNAVQVTANVKALAQLANSMGLVSSTGAPLLNNTFTNQDLQLVSKAVLDACDATDGLVDGMVNKPLMCTTPVVAPVLNALQCAGAKTPTCLTAGQISTIQAMYSAAVTPQGRTPYFPWMWDPGIAGCTSAVDCNTPTATNISGGWRSWKIGSFQNNLATAVNNALDFTGSAGGAFLTVLDPTPPNVPSPTANEGVFKLILNYDLDVFYDSIMNTTAKFPRSTYTEMTADSTDLSVFRNRGGKVVIYQPQSGGPFSALAMVDWYQHLNIASGGTASDYTAAQSYARLFLMPGAQHCGGGPSTSTIDAFGAVVNWVENGTAPARIVGTAPAATPWPGRTRPLCPFPAYAKYNGSGSIESEANFTCTVD